MYDLNPFPKILLQILFVKIIITLNGNLDTLIKQLFTDESSTAKQIFLADSCKFKHNFSRHLTLQGYKSTIYPLLQWNLFNRATSGTDPSRKLALLN